MNGYAIHYPARTDPAKPRCNTAHVYERRISPDPRWVQCDKCRDWLAARCCPLPASPLLPPASERGRLAFDFGCPSCGVDLLFDVSSGRCWSMLCPTNGAAPGLAERVRAQTVVVGGPDEWRAVFHAKA